MSHPPRIDQTAPGCDSGKMVWTTEAVRPDQALDYWAGAISEALVKLDVRNAQRDGFFAKLSKFNVGILDFGFCQSSTHDAVRNRHNIMRSNKDVFYILSARSGHFVLHQRNRTAYVPSYGSVLVDSTEPYHVSFPTSADCCSIELPRSWLQRWIVRPSDAVGQAIPPSSGWGQTLASLLNNLDVGAVGAITTSSAVVTETIGSLLALCIGNDAVEATSHRRAFMDRIRQTLLERYTEFDLTPDQVAAVHGISKRYLHAMFATMGTSMGAELRELRLSNAKRFLEDGRFDHLQISQIAAKCGFLDAAHFTRVFSRRFGTSPRSYRKSVRA